MSNLNQVVDFIKEIEKLKTVTRFNRTLDGRFENSAEHSWQCAIASMVLQEFYPEKLNIENVISMLLIHDLGEIYAGDTWVFDDKNKVHSHDRELESINKTMSILPEETQLNMKNSWLEFETGQSFEARYARVIDALVPLINHLEVSEPNYNPDNIRADMVLEKKKFIKDESEELWKLTEELVKESVKKVYIYNGNCFQVKYRFYFQRIEIKVKENYSKMALSKIDKNYLWVVFIYHCR